MDTGGMKGGALAFIMGAAALLPLAAMAQSPAQRDEAARELQRIEQEQRQREAREEAERRLRLPRSELEAEPPPLSAPSGGPCRDILDIEIEGAKRLPAEAQAGLRSAFAGQCLAVGDIERLLGEITAAYFRRGYIGARAYLPGQDLSQGRLKVLVVEGRVEALQLDDGGRDSINLATAFPGFIDRPLNLRAVEQGLDQINRLASNRATLELQPGSEPGATVLVVRNQPQRRLQASLSTDNHGSASTGRNQAGLALRLDNAAGLNDGTQLSYRSTLAGAVGEQHARSASLGYTLPFGRWLLRASQLYSDYATPLVFSGQTLIAEGRSQGASLDLDYLIFRDRSRRLTLGLSLASRDSDNALGGERLAVSSQRLSTAALSASFGAPLGGGAISARLTLSRGLRWFGAREDAAGLPGDAPHAQFSKWQADLGFSRAIPVFGRRLAYSGNLHAQWSDTRLFGVEQLLVGSLYSVRGFRDGSLSGERGAYWRNDLALPLGRLQPYLGLDAGRILGHRGQGGGTLAGVALGLAGSYRDVSFDLLAARALSEPAELPAEGLLLHARLAYAW